MKAKNQPSLKAKKLEDKQKIFHEKTENKFETNYLKISQDNFQMHLESFKVLFVPQKNEKAKNLPTLRKSK